MRDQAEARIVDAFYRGVCDDEQLQRAVAMVAAHFDSPSACLGEADAAHGRWMIGSGKVDSDQLARYAKVSAIDPAPRAFYALPTCTASTTDRLFSERVRGRSVFMNEYLRPYGLDHSMGSPLVANARRYALIGVHQESRRRRYDDDDIASLERLSPHVARTLQLRRDFLDLRRKEKTFETFVETRETGMIGRAGGRTLFANRTARAMAELADGFALDRLGRPMLTESVAARRFARLEADVLTGGEGGVLRVPRPSGERDYVILVSRLPGTEDVVDERGVLYSIHDPARGRRPAPEDIAVVLGIPRGPSRVVGALLDGRDLKTYADESGLSLHTVRTQLKAAFVATRTRSQADLVRAALSALNALNLPSAQA